MERELPNLGVVSMQDAETGAIQWVNTSSRNVRNAYTAHYRDQLTYFQDTFKRAGCGVLDCQVDESYVKKLLGYFKRRS